MTTLILSDGTRFEGQSFGAQVDTDGEVVFTTGMVGYTESLTDPSYRGQILTFTYPLIGNYGVPSSELNEWGFSRNYESENIHVRGVVVAQASEDFSHFSAVSSLHNWLLHHKIPGITGVDTRVLTQKLREHGVMLGRITQQDEAPPPPGGRAEQGGRGAGGEGIPDPNLTNLVAEVSCTEVIRYEPKEKPAHPITVIAYDCGMKRNILRSFLKRGVTVVRVPWDFNLASSGFEYDGVFVSNGPGDPKMCTATIDQVRWVVEKNIPFFGVCLGNQLLALAIGGDTYKLKYGHRGVNQPCLELPSPGGHVEWGGRGAGGEGRCIITSQNHGFAISGKKLPKDWHVWFTNANDGSVEGIRHASGRFFSVQFHPEATPGPEDANYLFDEFVSMLR
ncbi:MAG: glutamine-hydrolyzing carbamoyl-phosphate synthase small subunit [Candidatus Peregrinibacteria bacterium]